MDNQYIFKLIEKDLEELNSLVETLKKDEALSEILIDIVVNKATTLQKEIQLLKPSTVQVEIQTEVEEPVVEEPEKVIETAVIAELEVEMKVEENAIVEDEIEPIKELETEEIFEELENETVIEIEETEEIELIENIVPEIEEKVVDESKSVEKELAIETEEIKVPEPIVEPEPVVKKLVGERFSNAASLNDRISKGAVQSKVQPKAITSLKSAIGINDRFQFQRELFEKSAEKMNEAITTIDNATSIEAAIEYLEANFTWAEDETSLKFLELVKRRFQK